MISIIHYSLFIIEDQIDRLQGAKFSSTIDLQNGFHISMV